MIDVKSSLLDNNDKFKILSSNKIDESYSISTRDVEVWLN